MVPLPLVPDADQTKPDESREAPSAEPAPVPETSDLPEIGFHLDSIDVRDRDTGPSHVRGI